MVFVPRDLWLKAGEIGMLCPNVPKNMERLEGDFGLCDCLRRTC